ncbi:MAG TPA: hypothetical protein PLR44_14585 [Thermomicrobiales bacterium]|jgi:hypothetical protein|nr:hypothetical protein [Thermomicrobiales bacterium]HRA33075.1 hypothetical protein [Thermomicrobiales bacterium]
MIALAQAVSGSASSSAGLKRCRDCGRLLPFDEFYCHTTTADRLRAECKDCKRAYQVARSRTTDGRDVLKRRNARAKANGKRAARDRARYAARVGIIPREPCEVCGRGDAHAHHEDYGLPLDVRWLCPEHHGQLHRTR